VVVVGHGMRTGAHLASWTLKAAGFSCSTSNDNSRKLVPITDCSDSKWLNELLFWGRVSNKVKNFGRLPLACDLQREKIRYCNRTKEGIGFYGRRLEAIIGLTDHWNWGLGCGEWKLIKPCQSLTWLLCNLWRSSSNADARSCLRS